MTVKSCETALLRGWGVASDLPAGHKQKVKHCIAAKGN